MIFKIEKELKKLADKKRAKNLARFFKTGKGEYGEGDKFLGIVMPKLRLIAEKYFQEIFVEDALKILKSKWHEERMLALLVLMFKYKAAKSASLADRKTREKIFKTYLANIKYINNWDLVDVTCHDIVGVHLYAASTKASACQSKNRKILYKLAKSKDLWEKRIAIVSTAYFISKNNLDDTFKIAEILLKDKHDLIHKAAGWMLREAGKSSKGGQARLRAFLEKNGHNMPRTMLRYSIEKFSPEERKYLLAKY